MYTHCSYAVPTSVLTWHFAPVLVRLNVKWDCKYYRLVLTLSRNIALHNAVHRLDIYSCSVFKVLFLNFYILPIVPLCSLLCHLHPHNKSTTAEAIVHSSDIFACKTITILHSIGPKVLQEG